MLSIFHAWCKDQTQRNTTLQILSKFNDALIMNNELLDWNLEETKQTLRELGLLCTIFFHWPASRIYQLPPLSNIPITESLFVSKHYFCLVFFSLNILRNPFSPPMGPVSSVCFIYFFCFGTGTHLSIIKKTTFQKTLLHCYWPPITQGNILLER